MANDFRFPRRKHEIIISCGQCLGENSHPTLEGSSHLGDHKSPRPVGPLPNGLLKAALNVGDPNYLPTGMILQAGLLRMHCLPLAVLPTATAHCPTFFCSKAKCTVKNSLLHSIALAVWEYCLIIILKRAVYNPQYKEQPVFFIQGRKSRNTCWLVLKRQVWKVVSSFWFANHISHHPAVRTYRVWPFILSGLTS